ncbi:MAG: hypothetical protein R3F22_07255 [Lysobacteraceae bacterium]
MHRWIQQTTRLLAGCLSMALLTACAAAYGDTSGQPRPSFIAHAGGRIDGRRYTNSQNALDTNYARGFRYFELDFERTLDQRLVLTHDWSMMWPMLSGSDLTVPTHAQFMATRFRHGLKQLDLDALLDWLDHHPDAYIVTDAKTDNLRALTAIATGRHAGRFIPQAYSQEEFTQARDLGFRDVILTIYRLQTKPSVITDFVLEQRPWAIVVPLYQMERGDYARLLEGGQVPLYVHTVNEPERWQQLQALGVTGIYTDSLFLPAPMDTAGTP